MSIIFRLINEKSNYVLNIFSILYNFFKTAYSLCSMLIQRVC